MNKLDFIAAMAGSGLAGIIIGVIVMYLAIEHGVLK